MSNLLSKIRDMEEDGTLPDFDPTNISHVLNRASDMGVKSMVLYAAMDIIRDQPQLTNEDAILKAADLWKVL